MKILYALAGEGMGHATRSKVIIEHLRSKGHSVKVVASGRAFDFMNKFFPDVVRIQGLRLGYADGKLDYTQTILKNANALGNIVNTGSEAFKDVQKFAPQVVFTDNEQFAYFYALSNKLPIISLDNIQAIDRCIHPPEILRGVEAEYRLARLLVASTAPFCTKYVITTFFCSKFHPRYEANTVFVPPIVRREVIAAKPTIGEHVLVYQTTDSDSRLLKVLNYFPSEKFIVYGLDRNETVGNCSVRNFSGKEFVKDLASSKAVITNGGMSLLGEAMYLGKPIYSVPVRGHFEQVMNARYVAGLSYGWASEFIEPDSLTSFLRQLPAIRDVVATFPREYVNDVTYRTVDDLLGKL